MLCIRYSYSPDNIQDNYNEVLVNFFKYIETYDPEKPIQTWLHIVTKRFVIDMNNRNSLYKRSDDLDMEDITDYVVDEENIPSNSMNMDNYDRLYSDDVLNALDNLKPIYRQDTSCRKSWKSPIRTAT